MVRLRGVDSPWHRLPWTLPTALLIWAAALCGLSYFMAKPTQRLAEPPPIEAQLIEQCVPYAPQGIHPEQPPAAAQPQPAPRVRPHPVPVRPKVSHVKKIPAAPKTEVLTSNATTAGPAGVAPSGGRPAAVKPSANYGVPGGSHEGKGSPGGGSMFGSSGARAIIHPLPQIPEDLREGAFISAALARFHIAVDGSAEVELVTPTQDPRLNRILLDTLKKWRFFPAIKGGQPVATTEEILVKVQVR